MKAPLHPLVEAAAAGEVPEWAPMSKRRYRHSARVAELLGEWAKKLGLSKLDRGRWTAAGYLHDALKEVDPSQLVPMVPEKWKRIPGPILHGPAVASRLRAEGVRDKELLRALTWHTLGHRKFDRLGRALYAADFLEPGRRLRRKWRAGLRERLPAELDAVVFEILRNRIVHQVKKERGMRRETFDFWNRLVKEQQ